MFRQLIVSYIHYITHCICRNASFQGVLRSQKCTFVTIISKGWHTLKNQLPQVEISWDFIFVERCFLFSSPFFSFEIFSCLHDQPILRNFELWCPLSWIWSFCRFKYQQSMATNILFLVTLDFLGCREGYSEHVSLWILH